MTPARKLATALLLAGTTGLGACAVGPDYHAPQIPTVEKAPFREAGATGVDAATPASSDWWKLYADPTLSRLIEDAFRHNTDIRVAAANLRRARAQLSEARAGRLPMTGLSASYDRQRIGADQIEPAPAKPGGGPDHYDSSFYEAGFDASYELDIFGRVSRSIEAARGDAQAAQATLDGVRISIAAQVAQSYADACGAAMQADVARETATIEGETRDLTQRLLDAGRLQHLDELGDRPCRMADRECGSSFRRWAAPPASRR